MVLACIKNRKKRFKVFVANRLHKIRTNSDVTQWYYIKTDDNPVDYCSRDLSMKKSKRVKRWFNGPGFLWRSKETWVKENTTFDVEDNVAEVSLWLHNIVCGKGKKSQGIRRKQKKECT